MISKNSFGRVYTISISVLYGMTRVTHQLMLHQYRQSEPEGSYLTETESFEVYPLI